MRLIGINFFKDLSPSLVCLFIKGVFNKVTTYFVINLESVKLKRNHPCTLYFEATCPNFYHGKFILEYTGMDLNYKSNLPRPYMERIRLEMQEVFEFGSFEREKAEKALKTKWQFRVEMTASLKE